MITKNSFHSTAIFDEGRSYHPTHYFVYEGKYIGSFIIYDDDDYYSIWNLSIKEKYRNQGYGKLMMLDIMMRFGHKPLELYVLDSNLVAQHLYESVGFKVCGRHYRMEANRMEWRKEFV